MAIEAMTAFSGKTSLCASFGLFAIQVVFVAVTATAVVIAAVEYSTAMVKSRSLLLHCEAESSEVVSFIVNVTYQFLAQDDHLFHFTHFKAEVSFIPERHSSANNTWNSPQTEN